MQTRHVDEFTRTLPSHVMLVAATKGRSADEILVSGATIVGENYVQEAEQKINTIGNRIHWHFIGHLQKNKVKKAVQLFEMIQTVDSVELAQKIDAECRTIKKVMPVLIEVNSGREKTKAGVLPEAVEKLVGKVIQLPNLSLHGLMTMGPHTEVAEELRPFFQETKKLFDAVDAKYGDQLEWKYLSMGMSSSYKVAIEQGATMVRIGTALFGPRVT